MKNFILLTLMVCLISCSKFTDVDPSRYTDYQLVGVNLQGKRVQLPISLPNCEMNLTNVRPYMRPKKSSEIILDSLSFEIESPSAFSFGPGKQSLTLHQYESSLKIINSSIVYNNQDFGSINGDTLRLKMIPTANFYLLNNHGELGLQAKNSNGTTTTTNKCGQQMWYYNVKNTELWIGGTDFSQAEWIFVK